MRNFFLAFTLASSLVAFGETPIRVVDTLADLDQLYPNIEQPAAMVRGRLVRDDFSPSRIYFWNPDSTASTNDSVRPVRMGIGRWIYSTNATFIGALTVGETNMLNVFRVKGFSFGTSGILMERSGVGTNGISIAGGIVSLRREDPGVSRFIATFAEESTTASAYLGGNSYSGYSAGRIGRIYAPGVDLASTNEFKQGGDLYLSPGTGTGSNGVPAKIQLVAIDPTGRGPLDEQVRRSAVEVQMPQVLNKYTHNTAFIVIANTNYLEPTNASYASSNFFTRFRLVLTNDGANPYMTPRFYPEP